MPRFLILLIHYMWAAQITKRAVDDQVSVYEVPRKPATMRYEQNQCNGDNMQQLKSLSNYHASEVRETFGVWLKVQAALPKSMAWHIPQYPESEDPLGINAFLVKSNAGSQRFRRVYDCTGRAWCGS